MATIANLLINIDTNVATVVNDMGKMSRAVEQATGRIDAALGTLKKAFFAFEAASFFGKMVHEAAEAEKSFAAVQQTLRSTGGVAGVTAEQITTLTGALQKQTGVSDDALNAASALMLTFTRVSKDVFPEAISVVNDMSVALGQDLKSSTIQVGKALNDPIKGITALQRVGVSFTEGQKEMIKHMVETGHTMDAQKVILKELETEFGGAAAAARDTFGGALEHLKTTVGDLFEQLGAGTNSGLRGAVEFLIVAVEHAQKAVADLQSWFASGANGAAEFKAGLEVAGKVFTWIGQEIQLAINVYVEWTRITIDTYKKVIEVFQLVGKAIYANLSEPFKRIANEIGGWAQKITSAFGKSVAAGPGKLNEAMRKQGKDVAGDFARGFFGEFKSIQSEAQKNMLALAKASEKFKKSPGGGGGGGESESEKAKKQYAQQLEQGRQIVESALQHGAALRAVTEEQKEQLRLESELAKIAKLKISEKDKHVLQEKVIAQWQKDQATIKQNAIAAEAKSLQDMLKDMQAQRAEIEARMRGEQGISEELKLQEKLDAMIKVGKGQHLDLVQKIKNEQKEINRLKEREGFEKTLEQLKIQEEAAARLARGEGEITEQLKKQAEIDKLIKEGKTENLDVLYKQLDVLKHIDELNQKAKENKEYDDEIKKIKEMADGYKEQQEAILAKANGYEKFLPLLKQEREIQEQIKKIQESKVFSEEEKSAKTGELQGKIQELRAGAAATQQLNDQVEAQEDIVKRITSSSKGYYNQVMDLRDAFGAGKITLHQYTEAWNKLQAGTKEASASGKEFGDHIGKALEDSIINGKKLTDVFKDLAKELKNMAIKKLFIDPIKEKAANAFDMIGRNLFGLGKTNTNPYAPPPMPPGYLPPSPFRMPAAGTNAALPTGGAIPSTGGLTDWSKNFLGLNGTGAVDLNAASVNSSAPIYSTGPIIVSNGQVQLNQPSLNNPTFPLPAGFGNTAASGGSFGGLGGILGGILNLPGKLLGGLFGGGGGEQGQGGGGLLGGLGGLLTAPFKMLGGLFGMGGGADLAGPPNPQAGGLFGGLKSSIGGIAPLLNPFGFLGGLGSALGGLFGGNRMFGGPMQAGKAYITGEAGPELVIPGMDSMVMSNLDWRAIMQQTNDKPLYQRMGFQPTFTGEVAALMRKKEAYDALSEEGKMRARTTGDGYFTNEDFGRLIELTLGTIDPSTNDQIWRWTEQYEDTLASRLLQDPSANGQQRSWAADTLSNKTWASSTIGKGFNALPTGNQLGNIFTAMAHRGVMPSLSLLQNLNQRDYITDWIDQKFKGGQGWSAMFSGSGSREGMAGAGSGIFAQSMGADQEIWMPFQDEFSTTGNTGGSRFSNPSYGPNMGITNWGPLVGKATAANVNGSFGPGSGSYPIPSNIVGYPSGGGFGGPGGASVPVGGFQDGYAPFSPSGYTNPWQGTQQYQQGGWISPKGWQPDTTWNMNSAWYGGGKAMGGPVQPNKVYTWNENGREMLMTSRPGEVLTADQVRSRTTKGDNKVELKLVVNNYTSQPIDARVNQKGEVDVFMTDLKRNMRTQRPAWQT